MKLLKKILRKFSRPVLKGFMIFQDAAFTFRMSAGFAGSVTRTHPVGIEPTLQSNTPATAYAQPVLYATDGTQGIRPLSTGDQSLTAVDGILVRPFPIQQPTTSNFSGSIPLNTQPAPPTVGPVDILKQGYIMVPVNGTPVKGGTVYIWTAASSGAHVQGGFEASNPGGSGMALSANGKTYWNGGPDASGNAELAFNI